MFIWQASIRTKLGIVLSAALMLVIALGAFNFLQLNTVTGVARDIRGTWLPKLEILGVIKRSMTSHSLLAKRRIQTTDFRQLATIGTAMRDASAEFSDAEARYFANLRETAERLLFSAFQQGRDRYELPENDVRNIYERARLLTMAAVILAVFLTSAAIVWISMHISTPLLRVSASMLQLTAGEEEAIIPNYGGRRDEIGILANAANGYRDSVIRSHELADVAEIERQRLDVRCRRETHRLQSEICRNVRPGTGTDFARYRLRCHP